MMRSMRPTTTVTTPARTVLVALVVLFLGVIVTAPSQASYGSPHFDQLGRNAGTYGWESVNNDAYLTNRAGGVTQIRFRVLILVDGVYYEYKDVFVPDGYSARYKFYLAYEPTTVSVQACYYSSSGTYLGRCSQFFTKS